MPTSKKKNISFSIIGLIAFLIITFSLGLYFWNFHSYGLSNKTADWASFGAYVGGILGTCFAFATFWMLFSTFRLQQKQSENIEVQKFEATFYSLLELHNQKLNNLDLNIDKLAILFDNNPLVGKVFDISDATFTALPDYSVLQSKEENCETDIDYLKELQREILEDIEISQYFRVLYQLLKYIARNNVKNLDHNFDVKYLSDQSNLSIEYEKMYSSIARGFVPVALLPILALNCIYTPKGLENLDDYQALLERYNFLEHIRFDLLPKNLATFVILNNYSYALVHNERNDVVASELKKKYERYPLQPNSYFLHSSITDLPLTTSTVLKTRREKLEDHFDSLGKGFYSDEATIHEVVIFYISNVGTALFYTAIAMYILKNIHTIYLPIECFRDLLIFFSIGIPLLIAIYTFWITMGRIAVTLGKRDVSYPWAFLIIVTSLILFGFLFIASTWL